MKKRGILQTALSETIAGMGHGDLLVIGDAGLPVPPGVACIDLAVRCGLPPMLEVTRAVAEELQTEEITVADELLAREDGLPTALRELFPGARFQHMSHDELKRLSARAGRGAYGRVHALPQCHPHQRGDILETREMGDR